MTSRVRVAYMLTLVALAVVGSLLPDVPWWVTALIGAAVVAPISIADFVMSKRRSESRLVQRDVDPR
jgi:hypothetical protein